MFPVVGEIFEGAVVSTAPFGAFVRHSSGSDGLLYGSSERVGSIVRVEVLAVDPDRQRFSLSKV